MSIVLIATLVGLVVVGALTVLLRSRLADLFAIFVVVGVTGLAIVVSWNQVERYRVQKAAIGEFGQRAAAGNAVTASAPDHPRGGS